MLPIPESQAGSISLELRAAETFLHPSTLPDAIAADQRNEVREYRESHPGATVDEISEALILHKWCVMRRVAELDGTPLPVAKAKAPPVDRDRNGFLDKKHKKLRPVANRRKSMAAV